MSELPDAVERWICKTYCHPYMETSQDYENRKFARRLLGRLLYNTDPESPMRIAIKAAMAVRDPGADLSDLEALDNALRDLGEDV